MSVSSRVALEQEPWLARKLDNPVEHFAKAREAAAERAWERIGSQPRSVSPLRPVLTEDQERWLTGRLEGCDYFARARTAATSRSKELLADHLTKIVGSWGPGRDWRL